ncbi:hypothetical protein [Streptomyces omiyaensis]|uniref:Integral membrane protein n=1 Tax=Streptomyces omiyaensis TaxID=68247 RepID=A0ABW7BYT6_9ACTN
MLPRSRLSPAAPPGPTPLPPVPVVDGVPVWGHTDTAAWSAARPGRWARPLWSVLALSAALVAAVATEPTVPCGDTTPCGPDWTGMVQTGLAVGLLHWSARLPGVTLVAAPGLAALVAVEQFPAPGTASGAANLAVLAALGLGWAAAGARLTAARRQRRLFERTHGPVTRPLDLTGLPKRGTGRIAAGLALCAVAVVAILLGLREVRADEDRAAQASRTEAEVTGRTDTAVRLRAHDGRPLVVGSVFPEDQRLGTTVTVLEDGSWRRLAAEPYDAIGEQLLALVAGLTGLSLAGTGLRVRRGCLARRPGGLPAARVWVATDGEGRTGLHPVDATDLGAPLSVLTWTGVVSPYGPGIPEQAVREREDAREGGEHQEDPDGYGDGDKDDSDVAGLTEGDRGDGDDGDGDDGDDGDGDDSFTLVSLREAVLLGVPYGGAELAFVLPAGDGSPRTVVALATASVR